MPDRVPKSQHTEAASPRSPLDRPATTLRGVGPKGAEALAKLGIVTIGDLLTHYPRRYEDRARFTPIAQVKDGEPATLTGKVTAVENRPTKTKMVITKVTIEDGSRTTGTLTWFNNWRMKQMFDPLIGKRIVAYGMVKRAYATVEIVQPEWEPLDEGDSVDSLSIGRIVPVYPATEGVTQKGLRKAVHSALEQFADDAPETLPPEIIERHGFTDLPTTLRTIHFPDTLEATEPARYRLAYEELLVMQLTLLGQRQAAQSAAGIAFADVVEPVAELEAVLPFAFTEAQRRVVQEIASDMASPVPMNRLVQGDVGSGKTAVAMAAMAIAARNGYQCALMAPTEILAEQHLKGVRERLEEIGIRVDLLTGSRPAKEKVAVKERIASGETGVVVGTHALIQEGVTFRRLGLAIVDEQHRFGVLQRAALTDKGTRPDVLVMTATPIPRTLTLTVYGDLDVSIIDQLPPGRKPVKTHWKRPSEKDKVYAGIRSLIAEGRQAYVVCPLVSSKQSADGPETEKLTAQAATEMAAHLQKHVFPDLTIGLLHGQMSSEEKDNAMQRFRQGATHILVATTVIEVGVDVPNAATILIEDADRFGLSQLHQLRGRVGRGQHASFCILIADPKTPDGIARMKIMTETNDGFRIAEEDLKLRGPGEFFGVRQSGVPGLKVADILRDSEILRTARADAHSLLEHDPKLAHPVHRPLREKILVQRRAAEMAAIG